MVAALGSLRANAVGAAAGLLVDGVLGEPPGPVHPVAIYGRTMQRLERRLYADRRSRGVAYAAAGILVPAALGALVHRSSRHRPTFVAGAAYLVVAGRALRDAAENIAEALRADQLEAARERLPALVGRDPARLDRSEMARAVVESLAENTVDAIVAPVFWTVVAGVPGALAYRAVNTLDSMVGHLSPRYRRFGWAAARADDLAAWVPARLTALVVAAVRPGRAAAVAAAVRGQAPNHPSPNAGVAEAAFAAALGLRLGGSNRYGDRVERRPDLGRGPSATVDDIARAARLSRHVGTASAALCLAVGFAGGRP